MHRGFESLCDFLMAFSAYSTAVGIRRIPDEPFMGLLLIVNVLALVAIPAPKLSMRCIQKVLGYAKGITPPDLGRRNASPGHRGRGTCCLSPVVIHLFKVCMTGNTLTAVRQIL